MADFVLNLELDHATFADDAVQSSPDPLDMINFPLLVDSPDRGVRTEDQGIEVERIAWLTATYSAPDLDRIAKHFGTTRAHVEQALAYAAAAAKGG